MNKQYKKWIDYNYPTKEYSNLKCKDAVEDMVKSFPELKPIRGWYDEYQGVKRPHWWCKTQSGEIIDPTANQFDLIGEYIPYDESLGEPKGKCRYCGNISYWSSNACSKKHWEDIKNYLLN
jgi:hypothetical protein